MWLPTSLKSRLLLLTVLAALPVAGGMAIMALEMRSTALDSATRQLQERVLLIQKQHAEFRVVAHNTLRMLAEFPGITAADPKKCQETLAPIARKEDLFYSVIVFSLNGSSICSSHEGAGGVNIADRPYFRRAIAERRFLPGEVHAGPLTLQPVLPFTLPVLDDAGAPRLVLYTDILLSKLMPSSLQGAPADVEMVTLLDPAFRVLARVPPDEWIGKNVAGTDLHRALTSAKTEPAVSAFPGLHSQDRINAYAALRNAAGEVQGYAVVSMAEAVALAPASQAVLRALLLFVLTVLAMTAILHAGSKAFVLRRVDELRRALYKIAGGDMKARLPEARDDSEFSELDRAFNQMADKNESSMARITRMNRIHALLTAVNSAIAKVRETEALANEACRIAVDQGGYLSASIFLLDRHSQLARAVGHAGLDKKYFENHQVNFDLPLRLDSSPLRRAFKAGKPVVEAVNGAAPEGRPLSRPLQRNLEFGCRAIAAFPLTMEGKVSGVLQLFSADAHGFDAEEMEMLRRLGSDVAQGLEHIEIELRIREAETHFRKTFNQAAVGIVHVSPEGRYLRANQKFADLAGYSIEEILAKNFRDITHPDDIEGDLAVMQQLVRNESDTYSREKRLIRRDGVLVWCNVTRSLVRDVDDTPLYFVTVVEDITVRKAAESARLEAERHYRMMFEANPNPMWVYDLETLRFLAVNDATVAQYGHMRAEFLAMTLKDIWPPEDLPQLLEALAWENVEEQAARPWRLIRKDGGIIEVEITSHAIEFNGRRAQVSLIQDVTERNHAQRAQAEAEEKFRSLVEQFLVGAFILDAKRMHYANPRAAEIFGYTQEEITSVHLRALVVEEDWPLVESNVLSRIRGEASSLKFEFRGRRKDGAIVRIGMHGAAAPIGAQRRAAGGQRRMIGVLQDITEKQRSEEQIQDYIQRLERSMMATVSTVSRMIELRDPNTSGRERRVGEIAAALGAELGLDANAQQGLRIAGYVHNIGKITVPAEILSKPGQLTALEYEMVKNHAQEGYEILKPADFPWPVAQTIRQHHERMDGSGYPQGLKGDEIRLEGRIMAVAVVIEAMATPRPYRPALGVDAALEEIERGAGTRYDPAVVKACTRLFKEKCFQFPA